MIIGGPNNLMNFEVNKAIFPTNCIVAGSHGFLSEDLITHLRIL